MNTARYLGLDVGERRIGVALGDAGARLATPLTTLQAHPPERVIEQLGRLIREHAITALVLGLPLTLRGEVGPQAQSVQRFAATLKASLGLPIHFFDERLTSAAADQLLREMGVKPEKRKLQIDQVAAAIILQDFLDQRHQPHKDQ
ncbi:MAG: Holliday junction resolvase RuvX [Oscillochloridaceae bacterium umkhey_bin13]